MNQNKISNLVKSMNNKKQINELTNWNKDLQEENLNLKMQLDLLKLKSKNRNHG